LQGDVQRCTTKVDESDDRCQAEVQTKIYKSVFRVPVLRDVAILGLSCIIVDFAVDSSAIYTFMIEINYLKR
jgi:hypothetical protein